MKLEDLFELDRTDLEWTAEISKNKMDKKPGESEGSAFFRKEMEKQKPKIDYKDLPEKGSIIKTPNNKEYVIVKINGPIINLKELGGNKELNMDFRKYKFTESDKKTPLGKKIYTLGK